MKELQGTKWFGKKIIHLAVTDSTNSEIRRQAAKGLEHGLVVIADEQTAGRGRRGHSWVSEKQSGIWMSAMLIPKVPIEKTPMLTLVAAMAVAKAIEEKLGLNAMIKWPNDIIVNKRKICGILTEMSTDAEGNRYVVLGIGINTNTKEFPPDIEHASSLYKECGKYVDEQALIEELGKQFEYYYDRFVAVQDLSYIIDEYNEHLINAGAQVKVIEADKELIYTAVGIDNEGQLVVKDEYNIERTIFAGEVSVRGLYGYV